MKQKKYEERDHVRIVDELENIQRRDLAVHLYLSFLLRQVNPYFPSERWTSWPVPIEKAVDPREQSTYEDSIVDNLFRDCQDGTTWGLEELEHQEEESAEHVEKRKFAFQRCEGPVSVSHKRARRSNPKASVVNEMHAVLQKVIFKKASRLAGNGQRVAVGDSQLSQEMALVLSNKLDRVIRSLARHGRRKTYYSKTWQDVLIASLATSGYGKLADLDSTKKAYEKAKGLFMDVDYKYEYDPDRYGQDVSSASVPKFDLEHHLTTIQDEAKVGYPKTRPPLEHLKALQQETETKDHIFWSLFKLKLSAQQLSYKESDILLDYEPGETELKDEQRNIFKNKSGALRQSDFEVNQ